jgi:hypothetical protein
MLSPQQVLDHYFPEVRAKLIEIAAVLDRYERAGGKGHSADARLRQCAESLSVLSGAGGKADRAERIQRIFSDPV